MEKLSGVPLLFVEEGTIKIERGRMNIIKKIELSAIFEGIDEIEHKVRSVTNLTYANEVAEQKDDILKQTEKLHTEAGKLYETVGVWKRSKRGLFNAAGEGLKFLFGTMSEEDSKEISKTIKNIESNQGLLNSEMKQASTLITELNKANKVIRDNQEQEAGQLTRQ